MISNQFILEENKLHSLENSPISDNVPCCPETYSQDGEDIIISSLLRAQLLREKRSMSDVFYIEIGANHPIYASNTYLLYKKYAAHGLLIEADPNLIADLKRVRPRDTVVQCAISNLHAPELVFHVAQASELSSLNPDHIHSFGNFFGHGGISQNVRVPNIHINTLLENVNNVDFLSIDCEGLDYDIISSIDFERFKPFIIQCEPSEHFMKGNTQKLISFMESHSYKLQARTDINLIFTRLSL
ncbi:FkbM family methyltransferase [Acetobacter sp. LMG 32666]|uniref:FkbM family methyltransferase n=1 Tax=Acetobacter sp. LMG 32666 TaxID=2959295 RepID=UPI0030C7D31A